MLVASKDANTSYLIMQGSTRLVDMAQSVSPNSRPRSNVKEKRQFTEFWACLAVFSASTQSRQVAAPCQTAIHRKLNSHPRQSIWLIPGDSNLTASETSLAVQATAKALHATAKAAPATAIPERGCTQQYSETPNHRDQRSAHL